MTGIRKILNKKWREDKHSLEKSNAYFPTTTRYVIDRIYSSGKPWNFLLATEKTSEIFKSKQRRKNGKPVYGPKLPMSINFEEDFIVELVLIHQTGITTVLVFPKYVSPTSTERKPDGHLGSQIHLKKSMT